MRRKWGTAGTMTSSRQDQLRRVLDRKAEYSCVRSLPLGRTGVGSL